MVDRVIGRRTNMTVVASFSMSLDGFVADLEDRVGPFVRLVFQRRSGDHPARVSDHLSDVASERAVLDAGHRRLGHDGLWAQGFRPHRRMGRPPPGPRSGVRSDPPATGGLAVFPDSPFTFVTSGVAGAVAQAKAAGLGGVGVCGPNIAQQCLSLGLLDEVRVDLVPVLLGKGIRYFDNLGDTSVELDRTEVVEGDGVTHLRFRVTYR
jgi:dihydrofolate reductase